MKGNPSVVRGRVRALALFFRRSSLEAVSQLLAYVLCFARLGHLGFLVRALFERVVNLLCLIFQLFHLDLQPQLADEDPENYHGRSWIYHEARGLAGEE